MSVRILLGGVSAQWRHTLADLTAAEPQLEIVGSTENPVALLVLAKELQADVIMLSLLPDGGEPGICSHLVLEHPNLDIILLPRDPNDAALVHMVLLKEHIRRTSTESLRAALTSLKRNELTKL